MGFPVLRYSFTCIYLAVVINHVLCQNCPKLKLKGVDVVCRYRGDIVSCESPILPGTKASLACKHSFKIPIGNDLGYRELTCLGDSTWDRFGFNCIPECGTAVSHGKVFIINGSTAKIGAFPWHVGIYQKNRAGVFNQICGGTLVSPDLVISAAHCFHDETRRQIMNASNYEVVAGKFYRAYSVHEPYAQRSTIRKIDLSERYLGWSRNYEHDIALLRLESPFIMTDLVRPVCIDWDNKYERHQLRSGARGKFMGWGRTASGSASTELQELKLPFIHYENCITAVPEDFRSFLTADKFCAGYLNGSSLCDGDSGGGLCFQFNDIWYLRGIASVGPVDRGMCDKNYYTAFTNVGHFLNWIQAVDVDATNLTGKLGSNISSAAPIIESTTAVPINGCFLPKPLKDGSIESGSCDGSCDVPSGTPVPIGSSITYRCNEGYRVDESNVTVCEDNGWYPPPACIRKTCRPLESQSVDFECSFRGKTVSCQNDVAPWTKATLSCKNFYKIPFSEDLGYREINCLEDGSWDRAVFNCSLECGIEVDDSKPLIVNGSPVKHYKYPWRVYIYKKLSNGLFLIVHGGMLISPSLVITSAWWFDDDTIESADGASQYAVAVGKYHSAYNALEPYAQKSLVRKIDIAQGFNAMNLSENVALIHPKTPFTMTTLARPICIDWTKRFEREPLVDGERDKNMVNTTVSLPSNGNRKFTLPYSTFKECRLRVAERDKHYIMADKFCTGCGREPSLCGSNAHGYGFACKSSGIWYVLGLHSIALSSRESTCDGIQVFTNLGNYLEWIRAAHISTK